MVNKKLIIRPETHFSIRFKDKFILTLSILKRLKALYKLYGFSNANRYLKDKFFSNKSNKERYPQWIKENEYYPYPPALQNNFRIKPLISIVIPVYNPELRYLKETIASVLRQSYKHFEICIADDASTKPEIQNYLEKLKPQKNIKIIRHKKNLGISLASNAALSLAKGAFIGFLDHDDTLTDHALYELVSYINKYPKADIFYSDEDRLDNQGKRKNPFFKPDWSYDFFLSVMYPCHFLVYRKTLLHKLVGFRKEYDGSQDYDLLLRATELTPSIIHIPKILYNWRMATTSTSANPYSKPHAHMNAKKAILHHLKRKKEQSEVVDGLFIGSYRVMRKIKGNPLVSIIISSKDKLYFLKQCIDSIKAKTLYKNYELIIVDNSSVQRRTHEYFAQLKREGHIIIPYPHPFNFSKINNLASTKASGTFLVFLNNDTKLISPHWLTSLLEHAQRKEVGAVGAKLLYPNNRIQHAGTILGLYGKVGHAFKWELANTPKYFRCAHVVRNYSAITAACMMVKKSVFEEVSGFDERLPIAYNDVDFCLKLIKKGYSIVYTPYAELSHYESVSRTKSPDDAAFVYLHKKWGNLLINDPYYNPNLTTFGADFSIGLKHEISNNYS